MRSISRSVPRTMVVASLAAVAACSGGGQTAAFVDACQNSGNMSEDLCECIADLAGDELSENGLAFLIASMQGDTETSAALASEMPIQEATEAGLFMISAPAQCASQ